MADGLEQTPRVVVGVDGSADSAGALQWACRYARLIGATVDAVAAYEIPGTAALSAPAVEAGFDEGQIREAVTDEIRSVVSREDDPVEVEQRIVRGNAASVLIQASEGAELLVVGSRGRGGFARLLLGSVSNVCAHHASCPVVIIRPSVMSE